MWCVLDWEKNKNLQAQKQQYHIDSAFSWSPDGWNKNCKHTQKINPCTCTQIFRGRSLNVFWMEFFCVSAEMTEHREYEWLQHTQTMCICYCVWTGYTDRNQHPESQASVTLWKISLTSFRCFKAKNSQTLKKSLSHYRNLLIGKFYYLLYKTESKAPQPQSSDQTWKSPQTKERKKGPTWDTPV